MASTNQTAHYNLSQYVANDKPTYLVDYNGDMAKIDAGIYSAESKALVNEGAIGNLTDLDTTAKNNLVSAINEVNTNTGTNTSSISTLSTNVGTNTTNIGTMANLVTDDKSSLVNAVNEVKNESDNNKDNIEKFNLTNFQTYNYQNTYVNGASLSNNECNITVASNTDGSIGKMYGFFTVDMSGVSSGTIVNVVINTNFRPTTNINMYGVGFFVVMINGTTSWIYPQGATVNTNGQVTFNLQSVGSNEQVRVILYNSVLFLKDFGDTPNI